MTEEDVHDRLDRLESLVDQQQAEIDRQQETIADQQDELDAQQDTIERQRERIAELERQQSADTDEDRPIADGTSVKVLGEIDATDATGVLGRATGSGQTYGVRGEASATSGYGLSTPHDAEVGGRTELTTLAGSLTGGTAVTDLVGPGLAIDGGRVLLASRAPSSTAPTDPASTLTEMVGDGTSGNPYVIRNDQELQAMNADLSAEYVLGNDIDASLTDQWNGGDGFNPVGDAGSPFTGRFDGRGHTISGLTIARSSTNFVGLFAAADSGSTVENVLLADADITGNDSVGGIAALNNDGTIQQVAVGGSVTGTGTEDAGGIVGDTFGSLRQSYATASVSGNEDVGGLAGQNQGTVELSFAAGPVSGNSNVGGIVGRNEDIDATARDAYWDTDATNQSDAIGTNTGSSNDLNSLTTAEMQGSSAESNMSLLDFTDVWTTRPSDYPTLQVLVD